MKTISNIKNKLHNIIQRLWVDNENKAGVYLTAIVHLVLIIVLLSWSIHSTIAETHAFLIDFSEQEEYDRQNEEWRIQESVKAEIERELGARLGSGPAIRNVAVDASGQMLRDDRHSNPEEIYEDARRLQEQLDNARRALEQTSDDGLEVPTGNTGDNPQNSGDTYTGPSVISYTLDGRKAMSLPVPAYKCPGGGDVYVRVVVNRKGYVISTAIIEGVSSTDPCLQEQAVRAASISRFAASGDAPDKHYGEIVYRFIAQ